MNFQYLNVFLLFFATIGNLSAITFQDALFPTLISSGRANAMGNAFVCRVDDSASSFYNPAGLGSARITHFHLSNFQIETNQGVMRTAAGENLTRIATDIPKIATFEGARQLLLNNRGEVLYNRLQAAPNITTRYFSMGYLYSRQYRYTMGTAVTSPFEYAYREDYGPYWSLNLSLFGGIIKAGGTAVLLNRNELIGTHNANTPIVVTKNDYKKGDMFYTVAGGRITLPFAWLPTIAVTKHNYQNKPFKHPRGAGLPDPIKKNFVAGASLTPQATSFLRVHLEVNYMDATKSYPTVTTLHKIMAGIELDFSRKMFLRFGYGDRYGSFGLGIKTRRLEFDLTSYAISTSDQAGGKQDRHYSLSLSSGF